MQFDLSPNKIIHLLRRAPTLAIFLFSITVSFPAFAESGRADYDLDDDGLIEINDLADLYEIRNNLEAPGLYSLNTGCPDSGCIGFELTTDLDFDTNGDGVMDENDTYWNSGEGWEPIGDEDSPFAAIFDGNDLNIKNLYINRSSNDVGLFGVVEGATLQNIHINGDLSSITGRYNVGAFIGQSSNFTSTLSNCSVTATLESTEETVGGLVGRADELIIQSCQVNADISVTGSGNRWIAAGLVGRTDDNLSIDNSSFNGSVTAKSDVGGFVGTVEGALNVSDSVINATLICEETAGCGGLAAELAYLGAEASRIERVFVGGTIESVGYSAGGFISDLFVLNATVTVTDSLFAMSINGEEATSGLIGSLTSDVTTNRVIVAGAINGTTDVGGLVGTDYDTASLIVTDTYWDTESTGQSTTDGNGTGLTTAQLQCPTSPGDDGCNEIYNSWDESIWDFGSSSQYPGLIIDGTVYRFNDSDNDGIADDYDVDSDNDGLIEIDDIAGLDEIRNNLDGSALFGSDLGCPDSGCNGFELTADLDFDTNGDGVLDTNDDFYEETGFANGWQAIPLSGTFTAIFDGNDYTISNLYIESAAAIQGLFRYVDGAEFRNIHINGDLTSVQTSSRVGLLFGETGASGVILSNCSFSGTVIATSSQAGGIGGQAESANVSNCTVEATVSSASSYAGGFFGTLYEDSVITDSNFNGSISSVRYTAGLVGQSGGLQIARSYVVADISGLTDESTGGLIGHASGIASVDDSFVLGTITGTKLVGGLIGFNGFPLTITNSFVAASVSGEDNVGGLVGLATDDVTMEQALMYGAITNSGSEIDSAFGGLIGLAYDNDVITATQSYWDTEATGQSSTYNDVGTGLTTSELQCPTLSSDDGCTPIYSGWDENVWDFGTASQYPGLILSSLIYRDSDGDGVHDLEDEFPEDASESADSDGDGIGDNTETAQGMDPNDADDFYFDTDGDGVADGFEVLAGTDLNDSNDVVSFLDRNVNSEGYFQLQVNPNADYYENYPSLLAQGDDDLMYFLGTLDGDESSFFLSRFDANMNIDADFGAGGYIYGYDLGVNSYSSDGMQFESDSSGLLVLPNCESLNDCVLALNSSGAVSTTRFTSQSTPGVFTDSSLENAIVVKSSTGGYIVYNRVGGINGRTRAFRIDDNDELDTSFNDDNTYLTLDIYSGNGPEVPVGVFETSDDEFLLASRRDSTLYLAKIDSQGSLINSFGTDGTVEDVLSVERTVRHMIQDQADGFYLLADDTTGDDQGLYLYRLNADGTVDTSFGDDGYIALLEPADDINISTVGLLQQGDDNLLVAYSYSNYSADEYMALVAKLTTEGEYVADFGINGIASYHLGNLEVPRTVAINHNNKIVMAGTDQDETFNYFLVFDNTNDQDGDGVIDSEDAFPDDASEATDTDGDGIGDNSDLYPNDATESQDSDGDGVGDNADAFPDDASETTDTDSDGVGDNSDAFPNDVSETRDTDGDGVGDNADAFPNDGSENADTDSDGVGDNADAFPNDGSETADTDGDGVGDNADAFPNDGFETVDTDGDGVGDNSDAFPSDGSETVDTDGDGVGDNADAFPNDGSETADTDSDGVGDNADAFPNDGSETADTDGDGVGDNSDAFPSDGSETVDTDGDGVGDNADAFPNDGSETADTDSDGVGDNADAFPNDGSETADTDGDGVGDNSDAFPNDASETRDSDGDGVGDNADAFPNDGSETVDTDGDGVGDNADAFPNDGSESVDTDGDGVGNNSDAFPNDASETNDTDGDGVGDNADVFPNDGSETVDTDGDGVGDNLDAFPNDGSETVDTDGDGVGDNADAFPNDGSETVDTDGDGVGDNSDAFPNDASETRDTDGDGVGDNADAFPNDGSETVDTDGDGVGDNSDAFPNDASESADTDGDGVGDNADAFPSDGSETADTDSDGVGDNADAFPNDGSETADSDGDGVGDNSDAFQNDASESADTDGDGVGDNADAFPNDGSETADTDSDGVGDNSDAFPNDASETADSDGDGVGNNSDVFPNDSSEWQDTDGDGTGDNSDETPYPYSGDINFELSDYSATENGVSVELKVVRTNGDYEALSVDYSLQDGTATATNDYEFVTGTLIFIDGEVEKTITINMVDDSIYEGDETFTAHLSNVVSLGESSIGALASATIIINEDEAEPPAGVIGFEFSADGVNENEGSVTFNVQRSAGSFGAVSVSVYSQDGSAAAGSDYDALSETLTFADGETEKTVTLNIINDDIYEVDEILTLQLSNATGDASLVSATLTLTVYDDEPTPATGVVEIELDTYQVNENDGALEVNVLRTGGSFGEVSVDIVSGDQTAVAGEDYNALNQTVTFLDGETSKTVTISLIDDGTFDGDESFSLVLTNATGTDLGMISSAEVHILENDPVPSGGVIQFSGANYEVGENDGALSITITRTSGSYGELSFEIRTIDETAVAGEDYTVLMESMVMRDGETSMVVTLDVLDDAVYEGDETLQVVLSNIQGGATLGSNNESSITIIENEAVPASGNVRLSGATFNIDESSTDLLVTVLRVDGHYGDISVDYTFEDGLAINGEDYNGTSGTLYFADGEESQTIAVEIIDDQNNETGESFTLVLGNPINTLLEGDNVATITINDDDISSEDETDSNEEGSDGGGDNQTSEPNTSSGAGSVSWWLFALLLVMHSWYISKKSGRRIRWN